MVKYVYDAWGNHAVLDADGNDIEDTNHIGNKNPFRYRGYFYDVETGLYYLQTRYYDPETGRFISQDSTEYADPETINGLNLYAYCRNNPVMGYDPTGTTEWWEWLLGAIVAVGSFALSVVTMGAGLAIATTVVGALVGGAYGGITAQINGQNVWEGIGAGILSGISLGNLSASLGFLAASGTLSLGAAALLNFGGSTLIGAGAEMFSQVLANGKITSWGNVLISGLTWGVLNTLNFGAGYLAEINIGNTLVGNYISNVLSGVFGFIIDIIKSGKFFIKPRG